MIRVIRTRHEAIEGFDDRSSVWLERWRAEKRKKGATPAKFWTSIRREVAQDVERLRQVFSRKCGYCESYSEHVGPLELEHYRPKSLFDEQAFDWLNWLISCHACNNKKLRKFPDCGTPPEPCILDPTSDDVVNHIGFNEHRVFHRTLRGAETVSILALNRAALEQRREEWLAMVRALLLLAASSENGEAAKRLLRWTLSPEAPYSAMTTSYLTALAPDFVTGSRRRRELVAQPYKQIAELVAARTGEIAALLGE